MSAPVTPPKPFVPKFTIRNKPVAPAAAPPAGNPFAGQAAVATDTVAQPTFTPSWSTLPPASPHGAGLQPPQSHVQAAPRPVQPTIQPALAPRSEPAPLVAEPAIAATEAPAKKRGPIARFLTRAAIAAPFLALAGFGLYALTAPGAIAGAGALTATALAFGPIGWAVLGGGALVIGLALTITYFVARQNLRAKKADREAQAAHSAAAEDAQRRAELQKAYDVGKLVAEQTALERQGAAPASLI